jgi:hypothetical protein
MLKLFFEFNSTEKIKLGVESKGMLIIQQRTNMVLQKTNCFPPHQ